MEGPAASRFIPPCVGNSPAANPLQIAAVPSSRRYGRPRKKATGVNPPPEGGGRLRGFVAVGRAARLGRINSGFQAGATQGLQLRHGHGSQFMSDDFQNETRFLGIASSPAFVREPEGNGCIERFFKTLKEPLLWVRHFQSIPELVAVLEDFRALYNQSWLIERLGFLSQIQARERLALRAGGLIMVCSICPRHRRRYTWCNADRSS